MEIEHLTPRLVAWVASLSMLAACGSSDNPGARNNASGNNGGGDAGMADGVSTDGGSSREPNTFQVELSLTPARSVYQTSDPVKVEADVSNRGGKTVSNANVQWSVSPSEAATQFNNNPVRYRFEREGEVTIEACASSADTEGNACRERTVIVDDGPPDIELTKPAIGAMLDGSNTQSIPVEGQVTDSHGQPNVYIDDRRIDVDDQGRFQTTVEPRFGVNRIEVVVNDGLHEEPNRAIREVLWAPRYGPMTVDSQAETVGVDVDQGLALDLGQRFFDDGRPPTSRMMGQENVLVTKDLADILTLLINNVDIDEQIPNPVVDSSGAKLVVDDVQVGNPNLSVEVTDRGLDLYVQIPSLVVSTSGSLEVEGQTLDLTGSISGRAAAVAQLEVTHSKSNDQFTSTVDRLEISIDELKPRFSSAQANAIFKLAESTLRSQLESRLSKALREELVGTLPTLITDALNSVQEGLSEQTFSFESEITGKREITFDGSIERFDSKFRRSIRAVLGAEFQTSGKDVHPNAPGVPMTTGMDASELPLFEQSRVQVGLRLSALNGLLASLWRSGILEIDLGALENSNLPDAGSFSATIPPVLRPARGNESYDFILELGQLLVKTTLLEKTDRYGLSLSVGVNINIEGNKIGLEIPATPDLTTWLIETSRDSPLLSPKQLRTIVLSQVWPRLQKAIRGGLSFDLPIPKLDQLSNISPTLSNLSLTLAQQRPIAIRDGYVLFETTLEGELPLGSK
jgi:hypothetical protein